MIDDVINKATKEVGYDKEAYKQKKKEQKEFIYQTVDKALEEIKVDANFLKTYLNVQSKFDMYTPRNALAVAKQQPNATQLKEYKKWRELKAIFRQKNPKKVLILDPGDSYQTKDGRTVQGFNAKELIDISETNVVPKFKSYDRKLILQALLYECPVEIKAVDNLESGKICEWNNNDQAIYVCRSEDYDKVINAVATEIAKINLYENTNEIDNDGAKCIGYMICKKYNIDTSIDNLDDVVSKFSNMDKNDIINSLTETKEVLRDINSRMGQYLDEKSKETKNKEQER